MSLEDIADMAGNKKKEGPDDKGLIPEYEGKSTEDLWEEYTGYHKIDPDERINKIRDREKRVSKHRKQLTKIVEDTLGEKDNLEDFEEKKAKQKAADIVTKIAHKHYDSDNMELPEEKSKKEEKIREFLQKAGVQGSYEDLLQQIMNSMDLKYENLESSAPELKRLIDFTADYKDKEGNKIALLDTYLVKHEHREGLKKLAGKELKKEYKASASPQQILNDYRNNVRLKNQKYDIKGRETTYSKPEKKAA
ncbi:hypothetical protein CL615_00690 [archaeon]|jgi:hypothetical protein|nr:hypothetical protein [archaeon]MDP6547682.1 hypothetical protein [Candidatus Woesearchaeota archaeon]|tara:strand:+ start:19566 stop:20315 length:750 start_codon:yes stop_codon:yes gene_type:complete